MATIPEIQIGSVKVMRSHDYCHFEVCLSSSAANTTELVDELRKTAARLADKAVEQYKAAKLNAEKSESDGWTKERLREDARRAEEKPESERSPREKAIIKAVKDDRFNARRPRYDYADDWDEQEDYKPDYEGTEEEVVF